ncbi:hypothetical protein NDU88_003242 [Pleurodeles waltl]|uniref:Uncharacterized protein n=1 Tax=Pleurodeles waltl TaxID=8319 RepID=A0AAV7P907_PLEWA|nr:hypothetical protein NDU88_003242 [Pleurodeles waltl]
MYNKYVHKLGAELAELKDGCAVAELCRLPYDPSKSLDNARSLGLPGGGDRCTDCRGEDLFVGRLRWDPVWAPGREEVLGARAGAGRPGPRDGMTALVPTCRRVAGKFLWRVVAGPAAPGAGVGAALVGASELRRTPSSAGGAHQRSSFRSTAQWSRQAA